MFLVSVKVTRKKLLIGALTLVLVVGLSVAGVGIVRGGGANSQAVPTNENIPEKVKPQKVSAKTNEERVAYIRSFGWEVEEEAAEVLEVIIPEEFDEVYLEYNGIQKMQGFDLEGYAGKRCKRYTYRITNHPSEQGEVHCNLLVYGDKLIGGDVCSARADGFMHGFAAQQ